MSGHLYLAFDAQLAHTQGVFGRLRLIGQSERGPADEIGGEDHEALLQVDGRLEAHLDVVQVEDLFALLDVSLDGLPAVVMLEPGRWVKGDRVSAEVEQCIVLDGLPGVETLQGDVFDLGQVRPWMALFPDQILINQFLRFRQQTLPFLFLTPLHGYLLLSQIALFSHIPFPLN